MATTNDGGGLFNPLSIANLLNNLNNNAGVPSALPIANNGGDEQSFYYISGERTDRDGKGDAY